MEFIIIISILSLLLIAIKFVYKINIKEIKNIGENNKELDKIIEGYPTNTEVCKKILKILNNENVKVQEDLNAGTSLYIAITNKITIANLRNSFTRIQTIAHECLHSVQDRTILLFNFIYSNIYIICFYLTAILGIFKLIPNKLLFLNLQIILGFIYYFIRSYLEDDAMIKAKYLAKKYMEQENISTKEEIEKIINEYDKLYFIGIKATNYSILINAIIRVIILAIIFLIR